MMRPTITRPSRRALPMLLAASLGLFAGTVSAADVPPELAATGVAIVPADAAFLSATLRVREQWDRVATSNAWATLRAIPAVERGFASLDDQWRTPGTLPAVAAAYLELPDNAQAVQVLAEMVATDTFVYGEPSCVAFVRLMRKLAAVGQVVDATRPGRIPDQERALRDALEDEAARPVGRVMRCRFDDSVMEMARAPAEVRQKRMVVQTLVDNLDLVVVPDVVWGFRITKIEAARAQLARIENLANDWFADESAGVVVARRQVAGADFLVLALDGDALPWGEMERELKDDAGDIDGFDEVFARLRKLDLEVAIGIVGERVILSLGDSTDHLEKLVAGPGKSLLTVPALAPLVARGGERLTGVSYLSGDMAKALAQGPDDMRQQLESFEATLAATGLPADALADGRAVAERFIDALATRMPKPGPWVAFSFLSESGYEGFVWDWSQNHRVDGGRRLDLLEHAGGAPLAVLAVRLESDPRLVDDMVMLGGGLWSLVQKHGLRTLNAEERDRAEELSERLEPLAGRLVDAVRGALLPALADGQVGFVLDAKSRTKKPFRDLPGSQEPLPVPEPAIILPLEDAKLFREGITEVFAIGEDVVQALREVAPRDVPEGFGFPAPVKAKVEGGTVWSFSLANAGLDDQVRPAIGVGDEVAVLSLAPKQAARLLGGTKLETGSQLSTFEEPLAGAAALDVAGLVDAVKPWLVYATRYGFAREREGVVDADDELRADDDTAGERDILAGVDTVLEVAKCLRAAVAEAEVRNGALVTHWRNIIRDLPKKP